MWGPCELNMPVHSSSSLLTIASRLVSSLKPKNMADGKEEAPGEI